MSHLESRDPGRVREMFGAVAGRYDLLNRILSLSLDRRWRRKAVAELSEDPRALALDLCGGTGDVAVELVLASRAGMVVCCDFTHRMLALAGSKFLRKGLADRCVPLEADGLRLPFPAGTFDAVTVAFGIRNFLDLSAGLREVLRVLRTGGRLVVLEFSAPSSRVLSFAYGLYLRRIVPHLGDAVSRCHGPYGYLANTISDFPSPPSLAGMIRDAGFAAVGWTPLTGGIVCVHTAVKG